MNTQAQKVTVFKGILLAWVISALFILLGYKCAEYSNVISHWTVNQSLSFALICGALTLAAGIGWAARTRHFISNIDGSKPSADTPLDITLRYITNTAEQLILFAIAAFALANSLPHIAKTLLPVMGLWFIIARVLFWLGYQRNPLHRAVGFASTFHPTLLLLLLAASGLILE